MSLLKDPNARLEWPFRTIFRLFRKVIVETQFRRKVRTSWKLWLCKIKRKCRKFNILVAKNIFVALPILSFHFTFVSPTIGTFEQKVCAKWRQGCRRFLTKSLQKTARIYNVVHSLSSKCDDRSLLLKVIAIVNHFQDSSRTVVIYTSHRSRYLRQAHIKCL